MPLIANEKVLVTGATGFIGSHLCERLSRVAGEVHAVARTRREQDTGIVRWWYGDLAESATFQDILRSVKPDVVFHMASHVEGSRDVSLVIPTFRDNLATTVNLLTAATQSECRRIILCGSLEEPAPDTPRAVPSSPYAAAKWASSAYAKMFHQLYELPVVVMRVFMVYGPGQRNVKKLIPYVTLSLLRGELPRITGGSRQVDWIYVDDVTDAFVAAATADGVEGATIDVGSGALVTVREVVDSLVQIVNPALKPRYGALPERPYEQERVADIDASCRILGWKPGMSLTEGLRATVEWYRRHPTV